MLTRRNRASEATGPTSLTNQPSLRPVARIGPVSLSGYARGRPSGPATWVTMPSLRPVPRDMPVSLVAAAAGPMGLQPVYPTARRTSPPPAAPSKRTISPTPRVRTVPPALFRLAVWDSAPALARLARYGQDGPIWP